MRFLLAFLLLFSVTAQAQTPKSAPKSAVKPTPAPTPYAPSAAATLVLDLDSGRVLEAKNPHLHLFPASTTKMMTCLVAVEHGDLNQIIRSGKNPAATGESGIGLLEGENHTLRELIEAALVHSANDACVAIAEGVGGTQQQFVGWMNQKARELGCRDTHFANPHGLHDPGHYTSAYDLALIGRAVLGKPFLDRVVRTKVATIGGNWKIGKTRVMLNRNKLLFRWNQCDGLKTGYTKQAGNCLVASASQKDAATKRPWRLLAVALKSAPGRSFGDCQWLLQRAFAGFGSKRALHRGQVLAKASVSGGTTQLQAMVARDFWLPLRPFERQTLQRRVVIRPFTAPLRKGAVVGNVEYWAAPDAARVSPLHRVARLALVARTDVPQTPLARAVPAVGNRVNGSTFPTFLLLGLCFGAASLLLFQRHHARRRPHPQFQTARLDPRERAARPKRPRS